MSTNEGIFQKKPPLPRYQSFWDVGQVLTFIKSLGDNQTLTLKRLSEKLVVLLALTSADRRSELAAHDIRFRVFHPEGVAFSLPTLTKSVNVGKQLKSSFHANFAKDKLFCPCECLREYEKRTLPFRPSEPNQPNRLFLATIKPHKPVTSSTLAKWVKHLIVDAGVNKDIFKAHSLRGASTSTAARAEISLYEIIKMANWASDSTFRHFYYKPIHNPESGRAVLTVNQQ